MSYKSFHDMMSPLYENPSQPYMGPAGRGGAAPGRPMTFHQPQYQQEPISMGGFSYQQPPQMAQMTPQHYGHFPEGMLAPPPSPMMYAMPMDDGMMRCQDIYQHIRNCAECRQKFRRNKNQTTIIIILVFIIIYLLMRISDK